MQAPFTPAEPMALVRTPLVQTTFPVVQIVDPIWPGVFCIQESQTLQTVCIASTYETQTEQDNLLSLPRQSMLVLPFTNCSCQ